MSTPLKLPTRRSSLEEVIAHYEHELTRIQSHLTPAKGKSKSVTADVRDDVIETAETLRRLLKLFPPLVQDKAYEEARRMRVQAAESDAHRAAFMSCKGMTTDQALAVASEAGAKAAAAARLSLSSTPATPATDARRLADHDATIIEKSDSDAVIAVVREEVSRLRDDILARLPPAGVSYAAAAAAPKKTPTVKTPASRPALVLQSADAGVKTGKDVLDAWRQGVSFKDACFAPAKVQRVSNNKIRVEFDSDSQRDETLRKLASVKKLKAEPARRLRPLVVIKGVSKGVTKEEIASLILRQNPGVRDAAGDAGDAALRVRFARSNRSDALYNIVMEVSSGVRVALLEQQRVNIDHQRVRVAEYSAFVQCFRCLQFGHTKAKCEASTGVCSHCASPSHTFDACPDAGDAGKRSCYNCASDAGRHGRHGRHTKTDHSATSAKDCPRIQSLIKRLQERTDYGV